MVCLECKSDKPETDFYEDKIRPRGRVARCKPCYRSRQKQIRVTSPNRRYHEARTNALRRGYKWLLTFQHYVLLFWNATCFYCGEDSKGGIDRMMNEPYYSLGNALACCGRCNSMKSEMTHRQFLDKCSKIATFVALEDSLS